MICEKEPKNEVVCYIHGIGTSEGLEIAYNDKIKCFFNIWQLVKIENWAPFAKFAYYRGVTGPVLEIFRRKMKKSKISFEFLQMAQFAKLNG